ncbi:MAG: hypothetical protein JKY53_11495 [Flavobacteriales bacterium]|nr:hypothetical protein [Flavobacteriales bacterium]
MFVFAPIAWAQTDTFLCVIESETRHATIDEVGNVYVVKDNRLQCYGINGKFKYEYNNKSMGEISSIDVTNQLKILVHYKEVPTIVFLDNTLTKRMEYKLEDYGLEQVLAAGVASNNGFWVYDNETYQIIKLNARGEEVVESLNLFQMVGQELAPNQLIERNDKLFLIDESIGIMVFDLFGVFQRKIPLTGIKKIAMKDDNLFYYRDRICYTFNLNMLEENKLINSSINEKNQTILDLNSAMILFYHKGLLKLFQLKTD